MKKSAVFMIAGICAILLAFAMDVIICYVMDFANMAAMGDFQKYAYLAGDILFAAAGILMIGYSRKLKKQEEEK